MVLCRGLLIRGGDILEAASHVDTIIFDKTGTLTEGKPKVQRIVAASQELPKDQLLALAAALERESSHPLASAILAAAESRGEQEASSYIAYADVLSELFYEACTDAQNEVFGFECHWLRLDEVIK